MGKWCVERYGANDKKTCSILVLAAIGPSKTALEPKRQKPKLGK